MKCVYLIPMHPHGLDCCLTEFLPVQLGSPAVVLLLGVGGHAVVAAEEGACLGISSKLHLPQLLPAPVGVQVSGADEGEVNTQGPEKIIISSTVLLFK